jgi:hypothetical protein
MAVLCATVVSHADEVRFAKELTFQDVLASRPGDPRVYVLSGGGWLRTIRFGDARQYISKWLQEHPSATVQPVSRMFMTNTRSKRTDQMVYIWIEDGERSLNVDLVRAGVFPGAVMADMVDNLNGLNELLKDPRLTDTRALVEKGRAEAPQDTTERLMSDDEYKQRMRRVDVAETEAREEKRGIWSDSMKAEREAEGYRN